MQPQRSNFKTEQEYIYAVATYLDSEENLEILLWREEWARREAFWYGPKLRVRTMVPKEEYL